MKNLLKPLSFRFWVALGMVIAMVPIIVSSGGGFFLLKNGVIEPMHDIVHRQSVQIVPAQKLRILIWDTLLPVDEYLEEGDQGYRASYRLHRTQIESGFAELTKVVEGDPSVQTVVKRAWENWMAADGYATDLFSEPVQPGSPRAVQGMHRFHSEIAAASDKLGAVFQGIYAEIERDHEIADLSYERSIWIAGIAAALSLMAIVGGVFLIGRVIGSSVDRLVDGAVRFADGDRDHRIEVQVPPELHRVAEEFNHMISRIQESEKTLAELGRLDSLTGLPNRRAFDGAFAELWARFVKLDEPCCLMSIDIDHFKSINDNYGHAAGDEVLRSTAHLMKSNMRPADRVYRVGGEEFAVLMPETTADEAQEVAERIRQSIAATPVPFDNSEVQLTISIGLAEAMDGVESKLVIEAADAALYLAKNSGRNRVVVSGKPDLGNPDRRKRNAA